MKKLTLLLFLITATITAQQAIGFAVYQDVKLAITKDDGHGNTSYTPDLLVRLSLQGSERAIGHSVYSIGYQWAQLFGGEFHRGNATIGYTFTNMPVPATNIKYSTTLFAGAGLIIRDGLKPVSPEVGAILTFKLTEWLKLNQMGFWMLRSDLPNKKMGFNYSAGVQVDVSTDWKSKQAQKGTRF